MKLRLRPSNFVGLGSGFVIESPFDQGGISRVRQGGPYDMQTVELQGVITPVPASFPGPESAATC